MWPHAFVIDCYCLRHVTPLQIMLPLASAPLLLTAADGGREVCVWRGAGGGLLSARPAAELWKQLRPAEDADSPTALQAACEWAAARVLLLGFAGRCEVVAADVRCAWDGGGVELLPRAGFSMELPEPALSFHVAEGDAPRSSWLSVRRAAAHLQLGRRRLRDGAPDYPPHNRARRADRRAGGGGRRRGRRRRVANLR